MNLCVCVCVFGLHNQVAVIGGGVSGLSAALLLKLNGADVTLIEKEAQCGGHALAVDVPMRTLFPNGITAQQEAAQHKSRNNRHVPGEDTVPIDVGFQVFNYATYPNLVALFESLDIDSEPSDMSFSFSTLKPTPGQDSLTRCNEWGSRDMDALAASSSNLWRPGFWRLIYDVFRFPRDLDTALAVTAGEKISVGDFLSRGRYSEEFIEEYFYPMCSSIWSASHADVKGYPFRWLATFWKNHHLLNIFAPRPIWRVVKGSSRAYVQKVLDALQFGSGATIKTSTDVLAIKPRAGGRGVAVVSKSIGANNSTEEEAIFDDVILATHSDTSLKLLAGENRFSDFTDYLRQLAYTDNELVLHTDASFMPREKRCWAAWNYTALGKSSTSSVSNAADHADSHSAHDNLGSVSVTYWVNILQNLPEGSLDVFATLNPERPVPEEKILRRFNMAHPAFDVKTTQLQRSIQSIQGFNGVHLAGAWLGYGFHEDGVKSAMDVIERMGATVPWESEGSGLSQGICTVPAMTLSQRTSFFIFDAMCSRAIRADSPIAFRIIMPSGTEYVYGDGPRKEVCTVRVLDANFFGLVISRQDIGLGEAFMNRMIDVSDIGQLMDCLVLNVAGISKSLASPAFAAVSYVSMQTLAWMHYFRDNTREGSKRNISAHYDIGNDLYRTFLDYTMTYSSGIHANGEDTPLEEAQLAKLARILDGAGVPRDDTDATDGAGEDASVPFHILEIGCGWGSLAIAAAQRSSRVHVTGVTLSRNQLIEARERVKAAGFADRVSLVYLDYRDICTEYTPGSFDAVVSVEMIEAVGSAHFNEYFRTLARAVRPRTGKVCIQAISIPDERYDAYCTSSDFIREYIFPGGHMPCRRVLHRCAARAGLGNVALEDIGIHYATTLLQWRQRFVASHKEVVGELGFDERFFKMWIFYLAYCEAGFRHGHLHDFIMTCSRTS